MIKRSIVIALGMCLVMAACGNSGAKNDSSAAQAGSPAASEQQAAGTEEAGGEDAAEAVEGTETAVAETAGPEIVEITADNWEQYFEIVPYHESVPYIYEAMDGSEVERDLMFNAFELILKDEYAQRYIDNSGLVIDDEIKDFLAAGNLEFFNPDEREKLEKEGKLIIPSEAQIEATFSFKYDGEMLGVNDPTNFTVRFPDGYYAEDGQPIEFEKSVKIDDNTTFYYIMNRITRDIGVSDYENNPEWPSDRLIRIKYITEHLGDQLAQVCSFPSEVVGLIEDMESDRTGEILDHFEITLEDISGTVAIW